MVKDEVNIYYNQKKCTGYLEESKELMKKDSIQDTKKSLDLFKRIKDNYLKEYENNPSEALLKKINEIDIYIQNKEKEINDFYNTQHKTHKPLKRKIKKRTNVWVEQEVMKIIKQKLNTNSNLHVDTILTKEDVALYLEVKECQVEQVFMELNKKGILGQAIHHAPHDSQRDPNGFIGCMGWASDIYPILMKKEEIND